MATKGETDAFMIDTFREMFPTPLKQVFPYRLLIQPSETQIGGFLHEDFHAYVLQMNPARMDQAEAAHVLGDQYLLAAEAFRVEFKKELALLAQALEAQGDPQAAAFVQEFLATRDARRLTHKLDARLISYERWLEWEEGLAKFVEVNSLRQAFLAPGYTPNPEMGEDPYFKQYKNFYRRWLQELIQLRNPSGSGEIRFYMAGMAEAFLLDRLLPGWKEQALQDNIYLEDLLRKVISVK